MGLAGATDEVALRRMRHVRSEIARVEAVVAEFDSPQGPDRAHLGELFRAGHDSLRHDFEVSTPELDLLVDVAYDLGAIAARLTGGGFGGAIVALLDESEAVGQANAIAQTYQRRSGRASTALLSAAGDGAGRVDA